jgi:hypothetical protein
MSATLKIAVQKSGRLLDGSLKLLRECGIRFDKGKDQLKVKANNFPVELYSCVIPISPNMSMTEWPILPLLEKTPSLKKKSL